MQNKISTYFDARDEGSLFNLARALQLITASGRRNPQ